jgi:putative transposase
LNRPITRRITNPKVYPDQGEGSANRRKAQHKLARLHARIANIRKDATHKATTYLTKTFKRIGIEDLNVRGMVRNRHLARSIMDGNFGEFRRQLEYKARFYGARTVVANRWFPSTDVPPAENELTC